MCVMKDVFIKNKIHNKNNHSVTLVKKKIPSMFQFTQSSMIETFVLTEF